jgi:toxin ParE1/3/4
MKVIVRESAKIDLDQIAEWITKENPRAAARIVSTIHDRIAVLETDELSQMGRPGLVEGTRELLEYPYIIVYAVNENRGEIVVLSIVHGARDREQE